MKELGYLTSYSHRGRFYTLREIARFDANGLWSHDLAWFSRHGALLAGGNDEDSKNTQRTEATEFRGKAI